MSLAAAVVRGLIIGLLVWIGLFFLSYGVLRDVTSHDVLDWLPGGSSRDAYLFPLVLLAAVLVMVRRTRRPVRHGAYLGSMEEARIRAATARDPHVIARFDRLVEESAQRPYADEFDEEFADEDDEAARS